MADARCAALKLALKMKLTLLQRMRAESLRVVDAVAETAALLLLQMIHAATSLKAAPQVQATCR